VLLLTAALACGNAITEPETETDATRTILFTVTGSMRECGYVIYPASDTTSAIIPDCMVPFSVTVELSEGAPVHITAGKRTEDGTITVMVIEDGAVIGYDVAYEGDTEAQWIEGR